MSPIRTLTTAPARVSRRRWLPAFGLASATLFSSALLASPSISDTGSPTRAGLTPNVDTHVDTQGDARNDGPRLAKRGRRRSPPAPPPPPPTTTAPSENAPAPPPAPPPPPAAAPESPVDEAGVLEGRRSGPSRIEFDDRLIQGQTNKANAIYLFERRASELRSLVRPRQHYHKEIDESVR